MSKFFFFFNFVHLLFLVLPFFYNRNQIPITNLIFKLFFVINFFVKQRLRFSGLGYSVELFPKTIRVNVGLTSSPEFFIPNSIFNIKINKKKKKLLLKGYVSFSLKNFCSLIRSIKKCDVYKHKGVRWRLEKVISKEGKRSGKR